MQTGANDDFRETVRSRTDLVALIGESVALQPARGGREYVGLCPFHDDHNPSMTVSRERQRYKCWSCGAGGDCFSFVMEREGLGFPEALEMLAEKAGLEIPRQHAGPRRKPGEPTTKDIHAVLAWAESLLHRTMKSPEGAPARAYLDDRGVSAEMIDTFKVGFHPGGWQWIQEQARDLYSLPLLERTGLVLTRRGGSGHVDHHSIRRRLVFPIRDDRGRCVAFGGRVLPGEEVDRRADGSESKRAKYINGSDAPHFNKSQTLFGMDVAKDAIRLAQPLATVLVVEGYTDCIGCHQHGLGNAVAVLGTALTEQHVTLLKRFARRVVLVLDGDDAGLGAAERSLAQFLAKEVDLRVLALPQGTDPADFLNDHGADAMRERIDAAPEAWEFKLQTCVERVRQLGESVDARHAAMDEMLDLLSQAEGLRATPREDLALSRLSQRLMIDERVVRQRLDEGRRLRNQRNLVVAGANPNEEGRTLRVDFFAGDGRTGQPHGGPSRTERMECDVLEIVFADPRWFAAIREEIGPHDFGNEYTRRLFETCCDLDEQGLEPSYDRVTSSLEDPDLKRLAALLDDWSHEKQVAEQLRRDGVEPGTPAADAENTDEAADSSTEVREARPRFLELAVENLKWRRRERTHEQSKGAMAERPDRPTALDDGVRALLEGATRFHGDRARRKR